MVARNFRTARHHGEIDLIGWDKDVLCFIEVKTRTTHDVKPALAAVDRKKRHDIRVVISDYLRPLPEQRQWRFDVVTVYYEGRALQPIFEVFQNVRFRPRFRGSEETYPNAPWKKISVYCWARVSSCKVPCGRYHW